MDACINESRITLLVTLAVAGAALTIGGLARADVTVDEHTSMSLGGINIDIDSTEHTSNDKQRRDSETKCHGLLAMFCHDVQSGEIVRLDKQLEWQLEPKKKLYTERAFPTAEQRALAQQKLQQVMDQMKKCPMPQPTATAQTAPDTTHCQGAPQVDVKQSDEHATLAGHDTRKSSIVLSQTCTDPRSGDVCEIDYGFDVWLTSDQIAGSDERKAFTQKYLAAQGLDANNPQLRGMMQQFMAPYADSLKQLQSKSSELQGYPLRTIFYMAFGGPHCGKANQARSQPTQAQSSGAGRTGGFLHGLASNAVSGGLGGLFHHNVNINTGSVGGQVAANAANQTVDTTANAAGNAAGNAAANAVSSSSTAPAGAPATPSDKVRVISLSTETTAINTTSIPSDLFEIPAGWRQQQPKEEQTKEQQFTCPTAAGN
jgi:hypothetical protein